MKTPTPISTTLHTHASALALGVVLLAAGCKNDGGGTSDGSAGTGGTTPSSAGDGDACQSDECPSGENFWFCEWTHPGTAGYPADDGVCAADEEDAIDACRSDCLMQIGPDCVDEYVFQEPCEGEMGSAPPGACASWDPGSAVTVLQPGVFEVDEVFFFELLENTAPLVWCDDARIAAITGGFQWETISTRDLAAELGFQNGDIPLNLNGHSLRTWDDVAAAVYSEWQDDTFSLTFKRGPSQITYQYLVR